MPGCGRPTYALGLCQTHRRQKTTTGTVKPIRRYRKRAPGTVKLAGHRVSEECAAQLQQEAERLELSLGAMIAQVLEEWTRNGALRTGR